MDDDAKGCWLGLLANLALILLLAVALWGQFTYDWNPLITVAIYFGVPVGWGYWKTRDG